MTEHINIVHIQQALLLNITAAFIVDKLDVKPVHTEKRAMYWDRSQFTDICQKLIAHVTAARNVDWSTVSGERKAPAAAPPPAVAADPFAEDDPFAETSDDPFAEVAA